MKPETRNILLKAYAQLQQIIDESYEASEKALENNDLEDASLLATSTRTQKSEVRSQERRIQT